MFPPEFESLERRLFLSATPTSSVPAIPPAPAHLHVVATTASSFHLSWKDRSQGADAFVVQRRRGRSGSWWTCATVDEARWDDTTIGAGAAYSYRVRATTTTAQSAWTTSPAYATPTLVSHSQIPAGEPTDVVRGQASPGWVNVSAYPLFASGGPSPDDVRQGGLGDCPLCAVLAEVARFDANAIRQIVRDNGDATYTVALTVKGKRTGITVDGWIPALDPQTPTGTGLGRDHVTWAPIIEKAAAIAAGRNNNGGSAYAWLQGILSEQDVFTLLGFRKSSAYAQVGYHGVEPGYPVLKTADSMFNVLQQAMGRKDLAVVGTQNPSNGSLVSAHDYSVLGTSVDGSGNRWVYLRDPSGLTGPNHDGYITISIDELFAQVGPITVAQDSLG